jgi:hypothetical protein
MQTLTHESNPSPHCPVIQARTPEPGVASSSGSATDPTGSASDSAPELTHAVGTNTALIHVAEDGNDVQVSVAIDNLIKGAGGQGVQAMNLALGIPEDAGLRVGGMFPC